MNGSGGRCTLLSVSHQWHIYPPQELFFVFVFSNYIDLKWLPFIQNKLMAL